ncbi:hypothetical protein FYK55_20065 [Roseiconus nitratireducens]|uniref:Transposase IS200-like domain-containing protein n=1 Tax=Roseiconus nitratireducens TaxID=2605748 RepID=A0A5M6D129_9BACT|nr:hypothetical protein FYK55_20065 [Roseiconus nitratireducens]
MITAACYEHRRIIGQSTERLSDFAQHLCQVLTENSRSVTAWVVLANHYHALVECPSIACMLAALGKLHGRSSYQWNLKDRRRGRRVWCKAAETAMKSEGHFFATVNYIFHNPVRHGYCRRWTEWPHSNVQQYLAAVGREQARRQWNAYPLHEYGDGWDPPEL